MLEEILMTPIGKWVLRNKNTLSLAALALTLWFGWQGVHVLRSEAREEDSIEEKFSAWEKHPADEALYQSLKSSAKKLSGPHPIQARIAQTLLSMGRAEEAELWARPSIEKLRKIDPAYAEFADISLAIVHKKPQEALERSVSLKEALEDKKSLLYGKNLVRIAFLQQLLGNRAGETAAWAELEELLEAQGKGKILQGLAHRESDFQDYLDVRKKGYIPK